MNQLLKEKEICGVTVQIKRIPYLPSLEVKAPITFNIVMRFTKDGQLIGKYYETDELTPELEAEIERDVADYLARMK